ncbi:GH43 family beta-xylosidase [Novosphingobium chloroacetimidivorans]|uniref:GH43 family beta-xylosidase n=1 Tax=Novosphingobium chloroacetimidivorans TaxID=1428314 RepID=A0A7W7NVS5_9SPHN|nr:glycoside hydrolase family 43 protein [Novosphingobium chloroacetimidivorans]MBB4857405.1 GH43 family beta-xylosidase [Novosphingobium chloroacetimidivorans]
MTIRLSRRSFAAAGSLLPIACSQAGRSGLATAAAPSAAPLAVNPLVRQRADAQVFRHEDGWYYMTGSVPEYDRLVLRRSRTLAGLSTAEERVLWRHQARGPMSGFLWAPELHFVDGRWVMYFAAGPSGGGEDVFRIRTYAIVCDGADPMTGDWTVLGQFQAPWDSFNLDSTIFTHKGVRYFSWAQREAGIDTNSNVYIAPMKDALTLAAAPARLTVPTLDWEVRGFKVNEGSAFLVKNGQVFMTYSASATDARYCLGLLSIDENANLMDPRAWTKSQQPVFVTCRETSVYGPGHNSFTVDEQGRDILVYHGRDYEAIAGDPLFNPDRHTRIQRLYTDARGNPNFGVPVGNGPLPERFTPAVRRNVMLAHEGERLLIGNAPLPQTQFRSLSFEDGSVQLSPILKPGHRLVASAEGSVTLVAMDTSSVGPGADRFRRMAGPGGTVQFISQAFEGRALAHSSDKVRLAQATDAASTWLAD